MVKSDAGGLNATRIRPTSDELAKSVRRILQPIGARQGKGVNHRQQCARGWSSLDSITIAIHITRTRPRTSHAKVRHRDSHAWLRLRQPQAFVGHKEERFVSPVVQPRNPNGSPKCSAEIVLTSGRFCQSWV